MEIGNDLTKTRVRTTSNCSKAPNVLVTNVSMPNSNRSQPDIVLLSKEMSACCGNIMMFQSHLFMCIFTRPSSSGGNRVWNLTDVPSL